MTILYFGFGFTTGVGTGGGKGRVLITALKEEFVTGLPQDFIIA